MRLPWSINKFGNKEDKFFDKFAIEYLANFGILQPTREQKKLMRDLLTFVFLRRTLLLDSRLTDREKGCLYLSSQGMSNLQIARFFAKHERSIEKIRQSICEKLGCEKMAEAIALGIRYDVVSLPGRFSAPFSKKSE